MGEILADTDSMRKLQPEGCQQNQRRRIGDSGCDVPHTNSLHGEGIVGGGIDQERRQESGERPAGSCSGRYQRWPTEPGVGRVANGVACRVDRLKALGNGQVPRVAAAAWELMD